MKRHFHLVHAVTPEREMDHMGFPVRVYAYDNVGRVLSGQTITWIEHRHCVYHNVFLDIPPKGRASVYGEDGYSFDSYAG